MARKHEKFSYTHGLRYAQEQWNFYWNEKRIRLDSDTKNSIAAHMIKGEEVKAEAILKRLLRKQEKEESYICIGFVGEDKSKYYFTKQLKCKRNDLHGKLYAYKQFKKFLLKNNSEVLTQTIKSGYITPVGKEIENIKEYKEKIDITKPCIVKLVKPMNEKIFQF